MLSLESHKALADAPHSCSWCTVCSWRYLQLPGSWRAT